MVLKEPLVGVFDILGQVAVKGERRRLRLDLRHVLDPHHLALEHRGRLVVHDGQHEVVQLACRDVPLAVFIDVQGRFERLDDPLLRDIRSENDGDIGERSDALADLLLVFGHRVVVFLDEVPLVDYDDDAAVAADGLPKHVQILPLKPLLRIDQQHANVAFIDAANGSKRAVKFKLVLDLLALSKARCVHKVEIESEHVVAGVHAVAGGAGDVSDDVALLAEQGVDQRGLPHIWAADDGDLRNVALLRFGNLGELRHESVQEFARAVSARRADGVDR